MRSFENLIGKHLLSEIDADVKELSKSKSYIHLDELFIKYGEIGFKSLFVFTMKVHSLKYFDLSSKDGEPNLYYMYYLKNKDEANTLLSEYILG
ncbi:hypothetical protein [Escherichia coli]|uniref:hypothetical protein n=1 Tax=Escherichia coli TaxID=562 RepID=UPI001A39284B|nr:hypothetical protein [Escherichia coli]MDI0804719.1 hypothetical protein [Escherichia coli]MDI1144031.1 hypothetical protein [Escherichia coli]VVZ31596.1 Uncharacterised protein [Escherichia coli]VVZ33972.1 Uncharacterised protein [Escherichia coli]VWN20867.1 Uncharacterised protein [Escherichia coli]